MPTPQSHTHCQAAQANRTSQSLSKSVPFPTHTDDRKESTIAQHCIKAIAGEVVNRRSVLLKNFVLNGKESASNPLLHIHAKRWRQCFGDLANLCRQ